MGLVGRRERGEEEEEEEVVVARATHVAVFKMGPSSCFADDADKERALEAWPITLMPEFLAACVWGMWMSSSILPQHGPREERKNEGVRCVS